MTAFVVDTNVAIVANRRNTHADERCQLACVEKLESVVSQDVVVIDDRRAILAEYGTYLRPAGMPGTGDMFYKHVLNFPASVRSDTDGHSDSLRGPRTRLRRAAGEYVRSIGPKVPGGRRGRQRGRSECD